MEYLSEGKKRLGDKRDARLVRGVDGVHCYMAHEMPKRTDAECYMLKELDITELLAYIGEQNAKNTAADGTLDPQKRITLFHCICYMITKTIHERPLLNRYVNGRRFYQRDEISLSFVARKRFEDHAEEAMMILKPTDEYRLADFTSEIVGEVHQARTDETYGADDTLNILAKLPRWLMMFVQFVLKTLDWYAVLPKSLAEIDPGHATVLLSNLGSVGCDAVYHHLNNFGTNGLVVTIGTIQKAQRIDEAGSVQARDVVKLGITVDERLGDGFYFARSLKLFDYYAANPAEMEKPIGEEIIFEY